MYFKVNIKNWNDPEFSNYILRQYNNVFKGLINTGNQMTRALRHAPNWEDFGFISSVEITEYMKRFDLSLFQYQSFLINDPHTFAGKHMERNNKNTSLVIPLCGEFDKTITEWWLEDDKSFASCSITSPTLIDTTYPHSILYEGSTPRIVLVLRSSMVIHEMVKLLK